MRKFLSPIAFLTFILKNTSGSGEPNLSAAALSTLSTTTTPKIAPPTGTYPVCLPGYTSERSYCIKEISQEPDISCVEGSALNGKCEMKVDYTRTCPQGYGLRDKICERFVKTGVQFYCPKGYFDDGNACTTTVSSNPIRICEVGQLFGDMCVIRQRAEKIISSKCPDGSELKDKFCWKQIDTYDCSDNDKNHTIQVVNPRIEQISMLKKSGIKPKASIRGLQLLKDLPVEDNNLYAFFSEEFSENDILDNLEDYLDSRDNSNNRLINRDDLNDILTGQLDKDGLRNIIGRDDDDDDDDRFEDQENLSPLDRLRLIKRLQEKLDDMTDSDRVKSLKRRVKNLIDADDLSEEIRNRIDDMSDSSIVRQIKNTLENLSSYEPEGLKVSNIPELSDLPIVEEENQLNSLDGDRMLAGNRLQIVTTPKPHEMIAVAAPQPKVQDVISKTCGTRVQVDALALVSCPEGYVEVDDHCMKETRIPTQIMCGTGSVNSDGLCVPVEKHVPKHPGCPPKAFFLRGDCWMKETIEPLKSCPQNFHPADDVCLGFVDEGSLECPTGLTLIGDMCVGQIIRDPTFLSISDTP